jgi:signal transduction histidine kinase/DNA-binding response OmpR family regulator
LKIKYPKGISEAVYNQSSVFRLRGKYDSALAVLLKVKPIFKELRDSTAYADYLGDIGYLYSLKNDSKNALIHLLEALKIYKLTGSTKNLALLYNRFGMLYRDEKLYDSALFYYKESLKINDATGFKLGASANLLNIGTLYEQKGEHQTAIDYYLKALEMKEQLRDKQGKLKCFNNIGMSYMNLGKVSKAIEYHEKSLALAQQYNSNLDIAMSYINLGFDYQKGKNNAKALHYTLKGMEMAKQINDLTLLRESARVLYETYQVLNNYREAFKYHVMFKTYSDSIVNENNLKALAEIQTKYNVAKKENEITELKIGKNKQELQIQTLRAWYNLAIGLFIAFLVLALFFYYRSRVSRKLSLKLQEINDMKSHFFANLSHEFRTPLTLMLGPTEKLLEKAAPEDKPWLELIHRNASRLLFLDEQLLEFTKIDSGTQKIHLVSGNILAPLKSIAESFVIIAEQKNIEYSFSFPAEPVMACFDGDILEKVTTNLLSNAFKYTYSSGKIEFSVSLDSNAPAVGNSIKEFDKIPWVRIDVRDSGIGIPENKKEQIFERFYQLNHHPGNTTGGVGIGLALTRELLRLHHGFITLESSPGKGSLFSVFLSGDRRVYSTDDLKELTSYHPHQGNSTIPVSIDETVNDTILSEEDSVELQKSGRFPQVLIVDDNPDMRIYVREILQAFYTVTDAENGNQGFEIACQSIPDLIITDVMMHPVNGIEFCMKLKQDERTSHIPVIMLTALSDPQEKVTGLETGADDYVTKPFNSRELLVRMRNLITQRNKLRQIFSSSVNLEPGAITVTSADEKFLRKLIQLIEANIDNPDLDIEFLLSNIAMSRSQLHRKIKAITGQPITGFIRIIRIKRAAMLMEQKFGNVSDIMYAVGFNNLSYFTKCFREVYNLTPTEFMAK